MGRNFLLTRVLLALTLGQGLPQDNTFVLRCDKAPPRTRALFPRIKNRREKFRPPKIIGKNKMRNTQRGRR